MSKCTYLSNDSCYSVAVEDGVDIYSSEVSSSEIDLESHDSLEGCASPLASPSDTCSDVNPKQSFTFEAQVN